MSNDYTFMPPGYEGFDFQYYDRIITTPGPYNYLFTVPFDCDGKTRFDTNMPLSGELPAENQFLVKRIIGYCENETAFRLEIRQRFYVEFLAVGLFDKLLSAPLFIQESTDFSFQALDVVEFYRIAIQLDGIKYRKTQPVFINQNRIKGIDDK